MSMVGGKLMLALRAVGIGRSSALLAACTLPLIALIVGIGFDQFARQRAILLSDLTVLTGEQHHAAGMMLAGADRQLARMRLTIENAIADGRAGIGDRADELRRVAARLPHARIEGRDWAPAGRPSEAGNLIAVPDLLDRPAADIGPVDAALAMLDVVALESRLGSRSHWSYFFSGRGDFITIHPYVTLGDIAAAASRPVTDVEDLVSLWLGYDVFTLGAPARNPDRAAYWTAVYDDAGGAGRMVSHAAPVYAGDSFHGIVGTDVLLSAFQDVLAHMRQPVGMLAIVDGQGDILGLNGASFGGDGEAMRDYLSSGTLLRSAVPSSEAFQLVGDDRVLSRPFAGTPFRLLYVLPNAEINAHLLPRFAAYGWILIGLALTVSSLLFFLHHNYVRPGFRVAEYLGAQASGFDVPLPRLPGYWRAGMRQVDAAVADARKYRLRLEESEARFHAAISSLPDGFAIIDPEGTIVFHNDAFLGLLDESDRAVGAGGRRLSEFGRLAGLGREPAPRGDRWIACHRSAVPGGGQVILLQDVTAAKVAEMQIRESEERYRTVVNTQTEFVARYKPEGVPTFANDAYCRYMNLRPEDIAGRNVSDFAYIVEEDREAHDAHLRALTPQAPTAAIVFRSILPDGTFHWEEWTDTGIFDADGGLVEVQSVGRDITERKLAEEALRQSEKMAALGSLLAGVAHELNNPLSIVVGYAGMLRELADDDATRRRANEIHVAAERCARIVKTFLAMARSRPVEKVPVEIGAIIGDVVELAAYGLRSNGVEVAIEHESGTPAVLADRDQLHQVFMNLTLNAQQAMMSVAGARRLTIRTFTEGDMVVVTLRDTGHGVSAETKKRAFEPFFTTKPQGVGTGIGLSVCLGIVQAHGGTITLDPAPDGGAICRVELPAAGEAAQTGERARASLPPVAGHVLVVDDEPGIAAYVTEALEASGLTVTAVTSGREAQQALETGRFDAVLTDLRMPDIGGDRLVAFIADRFPSLASRVIVMTGDALGSETALGIEVGALIEKPVDLAELRSQLSAILSTNRTDGAPAAAAAN